MNKQKLRALPYVLLLLPFDIVVATCLIVTCATEAVSRRRAPVREIPTPQGAGPTSAKRLATIQILNWDGRHLLEKCLSSVLEAVHATGAPHRILVVDNGSADGSAAFVRERFPEVRVLELERNYGFVGGNNRGVHTIDTEIVVLLNNDMVVERGFLTPLLDGFIDTSVFAVTSQVFFEDRFRRREETGKTRGKFVRGFFELWHDEIDGLDERRTTMPVFWPGGGSCAFDRRKYLQMGGLDDLYHPFYLEDTDLSYQAWKRGWKCLLAPSSRVVHKHRATSSRKYGERFVDNTIRRNMYLFLWKNVTDPWMLADHILNLPRIHGRGALAASGSFELRAFVRAVLRLPRALSRRIRNLRHYRFTDREVLLRSQQ